MNQNKIVYGSCCGGKDKNCSCHGKYDDEIKNIEEREAYKTLSVNKEAYPEALKLITNFATSLERLKVAKASFEKAKEAEKFVLSDAVIRRYDVMFASLVVALRGLMIAEGYNAELLNTSDRILRGAIEAGIIDDAMVYQTVRFNLVLEEMLDDKKQYSEVNAIFDLLSKLDEINLKLHGELSAVKTQL